MHDTSRMESYIQGYHYNRRHGSEVVIRRPRELRHIPSLEKLKARFENPPPVNALEHVCFEYHRFKD